MIIFIANIVALLASILMVYSGILSNKKKILIVQSSQIALFILSNILLGGFTGALVNAIGLARNIYCYLDKLGFKEKVAISILTIVPSIFYNNLGLIGYLPVVNTLIYTWCMNTKSIVKFKLLIAFSVFCWLIYDIVIKSYTSALFDFATVVFSIYTIFTISKKTKKRKKHV